MEIKQSIWHCSLGICNEGIDFYAKTLFLWIIQLLNENKLNEAVLVISNYRISNDMLKEHLPYFVDKDMKDGYTKLSKSTKTKLTKMLGAKRSGKEVKENEEEEEESNNM